MLNNKWLPCSFTLNIAHQLMMALYSVKFASRMTMALLPAIFSPWSLVAKCLIILNISI